MTRRTRALFCAALGLLLAGADVPEGVQRTADALASGSRSASPRARASAADILAALGAVPAEGQKDLASAWARRGERSPVFRDRVLGPVYRRLMLAPHGAARFEQTFFAGQTARVAIVAVDHIPARLSIVDSDGRQQCEPARQTCAWVPLWTSRFAVEVENASPRSGRFFVVMQ